LLGIIFELCVEACEQLRADCSRAGIIELTVGYSDHREASGREKLNPPLNSETALRSRLERLLAKVLKRRTRVRRVALRLAELRRGFTQLELFPDPQVERKTRLESSLDKLRVRFGSCIVRTGQLTVNLEP
jgi:predicted nuclease with TOPRIM domain